MSIRQQRQCMLRNHQLFIGWHDVDGDAASRARYPQRVPGIAFRIERYPEPFQPLRNPRPNADGVFPDARGEDEGVKALQGSRQHSGLKRGPVDKVVNCKSRTGIAAVLKLPHIVADSGKSLQPAITVEKILHLGGRHALCSDKIENDPGIDLASPSSHGKSIESGEAHRAFHTAASVNGAHRSAAAQMSDDDTRLGDFRRNVGQGVRDVLVGESMESITPYTLIVELAGYGIVIRHFVMVTVKCGIEARDLRQ